MTWHDDLDWAVSVAQRVLQCARAGALPPPGDVETLATLVLRLAERPEVPELYDVARDVCHEAGLPWTDPRTGVTYPPPVRRETAPPDAADPAPK